VSVSALDALAEPVVDAVAVDDALPTPEKVADGGEPEKDVVGDDVAAGETDTVVVRLVASDGDAAPDADAEPVSVATAVPEAVARRDGDALDESDGDADAVAVVLAELVELALEDARPEKDVDERTVRELDGVDEMDDDAELESAPESEPFTDGEPRAVGVVDPVADTVGVSESTPLSVAAAESVADTVDVDVGVGVVDGSGCAVLVVDAVPDDVTVGGAVVEPVGAGVCVPDVGAEMEMVGPGDGEIVTAKLAVTFAESDGETETDAVTVGDDDAVGEFVAVVDALPGDVHDAVGVCPGLAVVDPDCEPETVPVIVTVTVTSAESDCEKEPVLEPGGDGEPDGETDAVLDTERTAVAVAVTEGDAASVPLPGAEYESDAPSVPVGEKPALAVAPGDCERDGVDVPDAVTLPGAVADADAGADCEPVGADDADALADGGAVAVSVPAAEPVAAGEPVAVDETDAGGVDVPDSDGVAVAVEEKETGAVSVSDGVAEPVDDAVADGDCDAAVVCESVVAALAVPAPKELVGAVDADAVGVTVPVAAGVLVDDALSESPPPDGGVCDAALMIDGEMTAVKLSVARDERDDEMVVLRPAPACSGVQVPMGDGLLDSDTMHEVDALTPAYATAGGHDEMTIAVALPNMDTVEMTRAPAGAMFLGAMERKKKKKERKTMTTHAPRCAGLAASQAATP
jgi:hypothetical protein